MVWLFELFRGVCSHFYKEQSTLSLIDLSGHNRIQRDTKDCPCPASTSSCPTRAATSPPCGCSNRPSLRRGSSAGWTRMSFPQGCFGKTCWRKGSRTPVALRSALVSVAWDPGRWKRCAPPCIWRLRTAYRLSRSCYPGRPPSPSCPCSWGIAPMSTCAVDGRHRHRQAGLGHHRRKAFR
jgi:hypothetical protein